MLLSSSGEGGEHNVITSQSIINAKVIFWHCFENALVKTIKMIPYNLDCEFRMGFLLLWIGSYIEFIYH